MLATNFLRRLAAFAICLALAGCCANDSCNCQDELADALFFRINYTRKRQLNANRQTIGFNASDIDTIRISRTNIKPPSLKDTVGFVRQTDVVTVVRQLDTSTFPGDTVLRTEIPYVSTNGTTTTLREQDFIVINNASPFTSSGSTKLNAYTYRIEVVKNRAGNRRPFVTYYLTDIQLNGRYDANGCCTCYQNTAKAYKLTVGVTATTVKRELPIIAAAPDSASGRRVVRLPFPY